MENNMTGTEVKIKERKLRGIPGIPVLLLLILLLAGSVLVFAAGMMEGNAVLSAAGAILFVIICICFGGLKIINPNEAAVFTLFGKYYGTLSDDGFHFINPFVTAFNPGAKSLAEVMEEEISSKKKKSRSGSTISKKVSTKAQTLNNGNQKVNDMQGNPVVIGSVVIWKVSDPTKAVFNVENYREFLSIQCDSVIRNTARLYPYDNFDAEDDEMTLRGSSLEIAERMKENLQNKVDTAGLEIIDVRITHLAYSEEIAAAMLKRQQAAATVAAREKIVEGAVGMVQMALEKMEEDQVVILDDERKAAMVSNLMVVLCGERETQPVINSGSIY